MDQIKILNSLETPTFMGPVGGHGHPTNFLRLILTEKLTTLVAISQKETKTFHPMKSAAKS